MSATTELIKKLRAAGLTQTEISRRTGIPQPRISRWEGGAAPVCADDALALLDLAQRVEALAAPRCLAIATAEAT